MLVSASLFPICRAHLLLRRDVMSTDMKEDASDSAVLVVSGASLTDMPEDEAESQ